MIPAGVVGRDHRRDRSASGGRRHPHRRRQLLLHRRHPPRRRACAQGHPLCRRRHQRRRLGAGARLLPDDRRPDDAVAAPRPDLQDHRPGHRRHRAHARTRKDRRHRRSRATCTAAPAAPATSSRWCTTASSTASWPPMPRASNILHARQRRQARAASRRRDHAAARSRTLPVRLQPGRCRRGLAARQRHRFLAARPHRRRADQEIPHLAKFAGRVSDSGEGRWTIKAAIDEGVPAPVLTPRSTSASARAAKPTSPTSCSRPCASNSAATWRKNQAVNTDGKGWWGRALKCA